MGRGSKWTRRQPRQATRCEEVEVCPPQNLEHFQICVHVIEARSLLWSFPLSGTSYVMLVYGKKKRRTTLRKKMMEPIYRESFVFEVCETIRDLEHSRIWLGVMETRLCSPPRLMGEGTIDLASIWSQPNNVLKVSKVSERQDGGILHGFTNIILSEPYLNLEQQQANYQIAIFAALGLNATHGKPPNTFVRVTFCGLSGKTGVRNRDNNPSYCEKISMVDLFPNINQKLLFEVCTHEGVISKVLASTYLDLSWISHDGNNGFVPTFGPSLLHMYGGLNNQPDAVGPYHRGALMVAVNMIVPFEAQKVRTVSLEPIRPVKLDSLCRWENFCIYCPILQMSMIDSWLEGKCGVSITTGWTFDQQSEEKDEEAGSRRLNYLEQDLSKATCLCMDFSKGFPVLQLAAKLPDYRFRIYRNNILRKITSALSNNIEECECHLNSFKGDLNKTKCLLKCAINNAAVGTRNFVNAAESEELKVQATDLDQKQLALMKQELGNINKKLSDLSSNNALSSINNNSITKKEAKSALAELKHILDTMNSLINKNPHGWPDIVIWVIRGGGRLGYIRVSPADILYSPEAEQKGRFVGRIQTLYFKSLKCPKHQSGCPRCMTAKVELQLWMGLYKQYYAFEDCLPEGYKIKLRGYNIFLKACWMVIECRVFICNAKLNGIIDNKSKHNVFVRIHILNKVCETILQPKSSLLTWNQVIKTRFETYSSPEKIDVAPPEVTIDVIEKPSQSKEFLIGRVNVRPIVDDRQDYEYAPKFRNYELFCGEEHVGDILMAVQLLKIPEHEVKNISYYTSESIPVENCDKDFSKCSNFYEVEVLPQIMLPQKETYKIDIKWWGLRELPAIKKPCVVLEINNLLVKSDVALDKKANSNFPNRHSSYTFEAPLLEPYCPPLSLRLYDCSTFGRTLFLGAHVVKNPNKFLIKWTTMAERDRLIKSRRFTSPMFQQVNQVLFMTNNQRPHNEIFGENCPAKIKNNKNGKISKWMQLIRRKQPKEEEISLLPMFDNESKMLDKPLEKKSWWQRYYSSKNRSNDDESKEDKIVIYSSELESQPEFSKFRDWCFNVKFYHNEKRPVRDKNNSDYCGSLKAGITIYNWDPIGDTVAVNANGVDLSEGYFSEYPSNDPAKFLIRVYLVKSLNIVRKDYTEKTGYTIIISLGKKRFKDRHLPSSNSSLIGEMYELSCTIPEDYLLTLSLYEGGSCEELIGNTTVDLEDRIYTKHRARIGLASKYDLVGPTKWRDERIPSEILEEMCACNHLQGPCFSEVDTVVVNGVGYQIKDTCCGDDGLLTDVKESICLSILHQWHTLPVCGYHLVPEHVETRTLYHPDKPDISQGELEMWIDIFPFNSDNVTGPIDITPPKTEEYELRIVVWNVQGLKVKNWKRKRMDIFIKGFIDGSDLSQTTDTCYGVRSEASFNWRMIFHLYYQHSEKVLIIKDRGLYKENEERLPPNFVIQVIDNCTRHILASCTLNLTNFPQGVTQSQLCTLKAEERKKVNLFLTRSIRAWWCLESANENGKRTLMGAIDLELTLLPKEQAELIPVGFGRGPPSPLPDPKGREPSVCGQSSSNRRCIVIGVMAVMTIVMFICIYTDFPLFERCQNVLEVIGLLGSDIDEALRPID